jgi:hypothetical protein
MRAVSFRATVDRKIERCLLGEFQYSPLRRLAELFLPLSPDGVIPPRGKCAAIDHRELDQLIDRLEIEIAHHGGHGKGKLAVTYAAFEDYRIDRHAIAPALRELVALGFIEITEEGRAGNREYCRPAKYRLTYRPTGRARETNEWQHCTTTLEGAEQIVRAARKSVAAPRRQKQKTGGGKRHVSVGETPTENPAFSVG